MKNESGPTLRIRRFATLSETILRSIVIVIGTFGVIGCVGLWAAVGISWMGQNDAFPVSWGGILRDLGVTFSLVSLFLALRQFRHFFSRLRWGEIFDREGIRALWWAGLYGLVFGVSSGVLEVGRQLLSDFSPWYWISVAGVSSAVSGCFAGAILIFFSWLLEEGAKVEEENRLTI